MADKFRVLETVKNGRKHLRRNAYDTILEAWHALKREVRATKLSYNVYDRNTDAITNDAEIESDYDTYIAVKYGRSRRVFTIVTKSDHTPRTFGHLLLRKD